MQRVPSLLRPHEYFRATDIQPTPEELLTKPSADDSIEWLAYPANVPPEVEYPRRVCEVVPS